MLLPAWTRKNREMGQTVKLEFKSDNSNYEEPEHGVCLQYDVEGSSNALKWRRLSK
ncbi:hypothetical protein O9992_18050 [Vibrio lentus]|nr:hypothetical protein [Vibrio lentus]